MHRGTEGAGYESIEGGRAGRAADGPPRVRSGRHGAGHGARAGGGQGAAAGVRGRVYRPPRRRHQRDLHRAEDLGGRRGGAHLPAARAVDCGDRADAQRARTACQALLPATPRGQIGAHPRKARRSGPRDGAAGSVSPRRPSLEREAALWREGRGLVAGVDEAGRGPLAGPVVAAAVVFPAFAKPIRGLRDSKLLSAPPRERLPPPGRVPAPPPPAGPATGATPPRTTPAPPPRSSPGRTTAAASVRWFNWN